MLSRRTRLVDRHRAKSGLAGCRRFAARLRRGGARLVPSIAMGFALLGGAEPAGAQEPIRLKILGGLAGVSQYTQFEEPFWLQRLPELSGGRLSATIRPFDRSGLRAPEILQLIQLGVVPFGTALLSAVAADEPELNAVDLPALNPTFTALRTSVTLYRPRITRLLSDRYGVELLGIYPYAAQVIYCAKPFSGLDDLAGRKVRTSSVGQSEMMKGLGAVPVIIPFAEIVKAVSDGTVDCAITGTMGGNEVGLSDVTTHIHAMAISWGLAFFGANRGAWTALPADLRDILRGGIGDLERTIWEAAERETAQGLDCNTGAPSCTSGRRSRMVVVPVSPRDEARRKRLLVETVLPGWVARCGDACVTAWNDALGPWLNIKAQAQ